MKTAVLITARMGSSRLEKKHLIRIAAKPIIQHLIDRINAEFGSEVERGDVQVIIATGNRTDNRELEENVRGCAVYYGDDRNIPHRHAETAAHHELKAIVAVDGDDVLCSRQAMRHVYEKLANGSAYVKTEGLPLGLNAFGYSVRFLNESLRGDSHGTLETGWGRIFDERSLESVKMSGHDLPHLRFTLDYPEDFLFFERIIRELGDRYRTISDQELVAFVLEKGIDRLNAAIAEDYWRNFNKGVRGEDSSNG